jgi:ABC-2 type transport system ATP-binding protein
VPDSLSKRDLAGDKQPIVLRAEGLVKRYGSLVAVDGLSLDVRAGEVFGLLGPNGAGKTTTIHMLCGLLRPDAGRVLVNGEPVRAGAGGAAMLFGICPQSIVLWGSLTCIEQLEFVGEMYGVPRAVARRRGIELLDALALSEKRDQRAKTLSGGMQRRLNLLLALVHDPEIVVLDEPEAGLDPQSRVLVREYVRSLARRKTVILTTHNMDEADRIADRVGIVDRGRLLVLDSPENLKRQAGEGDVLEIEVIGDADDLGATQRAIAAVVRIAPGASVAGGSLVVRARGVVELLPAVLDALRSVGARPGDVRLRENTLEDVFIALTGRRLRE